MTTDNYKDRGQYGDISLVNTERKLKSKPFNMLVSCSSESSTVNYHKLKVSKVNVKIPHTSSYSVCF
jgi:hypothetical protein